MDLLRVPLRRFLHAQGGVAGAQGVILVGQRRAEECHEAVAHDLVDRTLIAMDGFHHELKHWVENLPSFFGIAVGEELHRTLEVGEKHGDLLALALQRCPRSEDLFGEVLRRVRLGRREPRRGRADRSRALETELGRWGQLRTAVPTAQRQWRRALQAELRLGRVLLLAPGTLHQ
jgi:hypothetical protein